jgi:hypothetical protein
MNLVKHGFALHVVTTHPNRCNERGITVVDLLEDEQLRLHDQSTSMSTLGYEL